MWGLVIFLIGLAYGYASKRREDHGRRIVTSLVLGLGAALGMTLLGGLAGLGLPSGGIGAVLSVLLLMVLFLVGVWIGDMLHGVTERTI